MSGSVSRDVRRAFVEHRRLLAALLLGAAVAAALNTLAPPGQQRVALLAAAHDLAAGTLLAERDVRTLLVTADAVPDGALRPGAAVLGRLVAGPVRRGEALTDLRLVGPTLLAAAGVAPSYVGVAVRVPDPSVALLVRPGDHVDVLGIPDPDRPLPAPDPASDFEPIVPPSTAPPDSDDGVVVVAADALVLAVPPAKDGLEDVTVLLLAVPPPTARFLASASARMRLTVALRSA